MQKFIFYFVIISLCVFQHATAEEIEDYIINDKIIEAIDTGPFDSNVAKFPSNLPIATDLVYRGVQPYQWEMIDKIGDPLNCKDQLQDFQSIDLSLVNTVSPANCDKDCLQQEIDKNTHLVLRAGVYRITGSGLLLDNRQLIGHPGERVILDARDAPQAIRMSNSRIANLIILNAQQQGVSVGSDNLIYRVVVGNSGVFFPYSNEGAGFKLHNLSSQRNCIISAEAFNGFNHIFNKKKDPCVGCTADGFTIKHSAGNVTIIDAHSHHNSDHGFDFHMGGQAVDESGSPSIRVFYSSATFQGYHPYHKGGNNEGWKLDGSWPGGFQKSAKRQKYKAPRLIYGSASCNNKKNGFSKKGTVEMAFLDNDTNDTRKVFFRNWGNQSLQDPYSLKCEMFADVPIKRSFELENMPKSSLSDP